MGVRWDGGGVGFGVRWGEVGLGVWYAYPSVLSSLSPLMASLSSGDLSISCLSLCVVCGRCVGSVGVAAKRADGGAAWIRKANHRSVEAQAVWE